MSKNFVTGEVRVVASYLASGTCLRHLHPRGPGLGPDGRLYVTSFRGDATDIDRILIFTLPSGVCVDEIDLYRIDQARAFAQDLLFGPGGSLFVPIAGGAPDTGAVRRYAVKTRTLSNFVARPRRAAGSGVHLTFGNTNTTALALPALADERKVETHGFAPQHRHRRRPAHALHV